MVPSLESICGVPVVVVISNHPDVKKQIFSSSTKKLYESIDEQKRWKNAINKQTFAILKEYNPVLKSIFPWLRVIFIGIEMLKWTENLQTRFNLPLEFSQDFIKSSFFTSKGIIDEEKAARELIKEQSLSLLLKYKIACHFYLQDIVQKLWQELKTNEPNFQKILSELGSETPMVMWSNYLEERKNTSVENEPFITSKFRMKVFSCGVKNTNVAAVKFSLDPEGEFRSSKNEREIKLKLLHTSLINCVRLIPKSFPPKPSLQFLLSRNIVTHYNFIDYALSTKFAKKLFLKSHLALQVLEYFLNWPYQYKFMKIVQIGFGIMSEDEYHYHLRLIISFIQEESLNSSYNYRQLFREFWIKSPPSFKKYVIDIEANEDLLSSNVNLSGYCLLIEGLFEIRQFTSDDMQNVYLIVKESSPIQKKNILKIQGKYICNNLCSLGNYEKANFFFNVLELDQDTVKAFKKDLAFDFFLYIIKKKSTECVSDEFYKWILGTDEINELKDEIFYTLTHTDKIVNLFKDFPTKKRLSLINKILNFFLKADDKIEEWKESILLDVATLSLPLIRNDNPYWLDNLLIYLGTSDDKTSEIKSEILLRNLPNFAKCFFYQEQFFSKNISFLCLYEKEKVSNFINKLRAYYEDSIEHKICLLCMNNNLISSNGNETQLQCEYHGTNGFISRNNVNEICSSFSKCINKVLKNHRTSLKQSLERRQKSSIS